MDFIRIGESKLKITLTKEELGLYGMDLSALDYASTETRRAFWAILDDAKHETGFDAASAKVCVQIFTSKTGGCEMFVTLTVSPAQHFTAPDEQTMALTVCGVLPKLYSEIICCFDSLTKLITACKVLSEQGYRYDSSAWQMPQQRSAGECYYLYLKGNRSDQAYSATSSGILAEFGIPLPELTMGYLNEHCVPLVVDQAVERLSALAV